MSQPENPPESQPECQPGRPGVSPGAIPFTHRAEVIRTEIVREKVATEPAALGGSEATEATEAAREHERIERQMLIRDPLPPVDSDLEYVDASHCCRECVLVLFGGKPALGVARANAREGWVECLSGEWQSTRNYQRKRIYGAVKIVVDAPARVAERMSQAEYLW